MAQQHSASLTVSPPVTIGACATLACLWEATAPKPGNVYRGADFEDLTYVDFLTSAALIGPILEKAAECGVGATVLECVRQTRAAVETNTNLGILLLLTPMAAVPADVPLEIGIGTLYASLTDEDTKYVFEAIRTAQPGGMSKVDKADVNETTAPEISLLEAMQLAADRDLIARQYTNEFQQVFVVAKHIQQAYLSGIPLSDAIVHAFLQLLAEFPDSLIARKCGVEVAQHVSTQASAVLAQGQPGNKTYEAALGEFDFSLRVDGHRRNPGTSADMIAAALFVLLRENRLDWPVKFYRIPEPSK